ncbi:neurocalcin homolog isoform X2 [Littorina saxatilis]|uniref:neurocalcin homolog isoform X2 n=1 Tax=Littorina saxatilis TaxID=31220 RepID=UPI0038B66E27
MVVGCGNFCTRPPESQNCKAKNRRHIRDTMGQVSVKQKLGQRQVRELQRHVSFSEPEIHDWYHEFCQSTHRSRKDSVYLTEEEFCTVYKSVYPGKSDDFARHIFRTFDMDANDRVDFREFLIGLSISGSDDAEKQVSWAFRVYDVQKTGYIIKEEMTQIIRAVFKMMGVREITDNGETKTPEDLADEMFRQMDKDGDDRISWKEFRDGAKANPIVLRLLQCSPPDKQGHIDEGAEGEVFT